MEGWIKLHRSIQDNWIWSNSTYLRAWIIILFTVNYEDKKVLIHGNIIECKRGQSLLSLDHWVDKFGISKKSGSWTIQKVRTFFNLLQKDNMIQCENVSKTTRLTVCNYNYYQDVQQDNNKIITGLQQDNNKIITTTKESKEIKNKKKTEDFTTQSFNFYSEEVKKAKEYPSDQMAKDYIDLCRHICKKDKDGSWDMYFVLKIQKQISLDQFSVLYKRSGKNLDAIIAKVDSVQNKVDYHNTYTDLFKTINSWFINDIKRNNK